MLKKVKLGTAQVGAVAQNINERTFFRENYRFPDKMFGMITFLFL